MSEETKAIQITALMTAPRHEIVLSRSYIEMSLHAAGVPLVVSGGVFYGQCMQRMLSDAIDSGADVAITVDFDSMFTANDVRNLVSTLINTDADAVAALQCRRGKKFPLMTITGERSREIDGTPFRVDTAHFGLTAIDLHKLKTVPKPWFWSKPGKDGEWGDDKIDDDIWFWYQWKDAGLKVAIDPNVKIGHLEEMVVMFDEQLQPVHVYPTEWAQLAFAPPKGKGTLVFVGANQAGESMIELTKKHEISYLFEPLPDVAESLRQTFEGREDVRVMELACSELCGKKTLHRYNTNGVSSSFGKVTEQAKQLFNAVDWTEQGTIEVHTVNLYDWWYSCEIGPIETLVIDAQGMDLTILKTLKPLLERGEIRYIQCEANGNGFQHYEGLPDNSEQGFISFMEQYPWYVFGRVEGTVDFQPDLTWGFDKEAFEKSKELCHV